MCTALPATDDVSPNRGVGKTGHSYMTSVRMWSTVNVGRSKDLINRSVEDGMCQSRAYPPTTSRLVRLTNSALRVKKHYSCTR